VPLGAPAPRPRATVTRVVHEVEISLLDGFAPERSAMRRKADALSEEWVRLYREGASDRLGIRIISTPLESKPSSVNLGLIR